MVAVSVSSTVFMLSMDGRREAFVVTNSEITLGEMQEHVLDLFEKTYPETWVSLIMESVTYTLPDSTATARRRWGRFGNSLLQQARA